jgi:hypothetical protein
MGSDTTKGTLTTLTPEDFVIDKSGRVYFVDPQIADAVNFAKSADEAEGDPAAREALAAARGNNCRCFNRGCRPPVM